MPAPKPSKRILASLDEKKKHEIITRYRAGKSLRDLAEETGVNSGILWSLFQQWGIVLRTRSEMRIKKLPIEELKTFYQLGWTVFRLAKHYKTSLVTIADRLQKAGVTIDANRLDHERVQQLQTRDDSIAKLRAEGKTLREIGDILGLTESGVSRRLKKRRLNETTPPYEQPDEGIIHAECEAECTTDASDQASDPKPSP